MASESVPPSVRCVTSPDEVDFRDVFIIESHGRVKTDPVTPRYGRKLESRFAVVGFLCCILCGCAGFVLNTASGDLRLSPAAMAFGNVSVGKTVSSNMSLKNQGTTALSVGSLTVSGQAFSLTGVTPMPFTLAPGASRVVAITFAPSNQGNFAGQLTAMDGSNQTLASASITGQGMTPVTPQLDISSSTLTFGSAVLDSPVTQSITLTSSGTAPVTVSSIDLSGSGFSITGATAPATLSPGQTLSLQVSFDPTVAGAASGTITISSNSTTGGTSVVSLSGTGTAAATPQLTVSVGTLAFGSVTLNTASTKTLTLTSSGTAALTVNAVSLAGTGFAISGATFPALLNPGQTVTLQVSFDPTVAGAVSGTITISSNSTTGGTSMVGLTGTGTQAATPQLTVSAGNLAFGSVTLNTTSTQTLTLTSSGTAALTVNAVSLAGTGFAISGATFPALLNPGQTVTLQVSFDPTVAGAVSGTITISSNSTTGGTSMVGLTGTGTQAATPQLTVSAGNLAFGSVTLNTTSTQTLTLTSSGTAALTVNAVSLAGTGFAISGATFPALLNPGQTVTLQVSFDPTVAGAASGTITISSNSTTGGTSMVSLSGTGTQAANPALTLSTTNLSFGSDPVGTLVSLPVTLTSSGTSPVTVSAANLAGSGFTYSGATFPVTLNPTIAITIQVHFDPTAAGATSGTLMFTSNSTTGTTSTVNLSGTGTAVQHQVSLGWAAPTNSPVPVTKYDIYRGTGSSPSFQLLSSSTTTAYVDLTVTAGATYTYYVTSVDSAGTESTPSNQVIVTIP